MKIILRTNNNFQTVIESNGFFPCVGDIIELNDGSQFKVTSRFYFHKDIDDHESYILLQGEMIVLGSLFLSSEWNKIN